MKVANIIEKVRSNRQENQIYYDSINSEIETLEEKKLEPPHSIEIADDVLVSLQGIVDGTFGEDSWFDDADVKWYLEKYGHCGAAHDEWRNDYMEGCERSARENRLCKNGVCLIMFRPSKEHAERLLKEVNAPS